MKTLKTDYVLYLQNLRNDFYNRNNKKAALKVQADLNNISK